MWLFDVDGKIQKYDSPEAEPFSKERTVARSCSVKKILSWPCHKVSLIFVLFWVRCPVMFGRPTPATTETQRKMHIQKLVVLRSGFLFFIHAFACKLRSLHLELQEILQAFFPVRYEMYERRKAMAVYCGFHVLQNLVDSRPCLQLVGKALKKFGQP